MSSKTLARAGYALINRFLLPSNLVQLPFREANVILSAKISSNHSIRSLLPRFQVGRSPPLQDIGLGVGGEAETIRRVASAEGISFPCGLPSLRFFIGDGEDALTNEPVLLLPKRTYQPSTIRRKRNHGYLARKATKGGRKVIARRLAKGRARIAV